MKTRFKNAAFALILPMALMISASSVSVAQEVPVPPVVWKTAVHLFKNQLDAVTSEYLLPGHYSEIQTIEEQKGIQAALSILSNAFGDILDMRVNEGLAKWVNLDIFGGDAEFIKNHSDVFLYVYRVTFSKLGNGYIIIQTYPNGGTPKLRSIGYGLPDLPGNRDVLKPVAEELMRLLLSYQARKQV